MSTPPRRSSLSRKGTSHAAVEDHREGGALRHPDGRPDVLREEVGSEVGELRQQSRAQPHHRRGPRSACRGAGASSPSGFWLPVVVESLVTYGQRRSSECGTPIGMRRHWRARSVLLGELTFPRVIHDVHTQEVERPVRRSRAWATPHQAHTIKRSGDFTSWASNSSLNALTHLAAAIRTSERRLVETNTCASSEEGLLSRNSTLVPRSRFWGPCAAELPDGTRPRKPPLEAARRTKC